MQENGLYDFSALTPEVILGAVEQAAGIFLSGMMLRLPSYINRVYELQSEEGAALIVKFYRPGRWSPQAIAEEHAFILACAQAEVPVIAPLKQQTGGTLGEVAGIPFALYAKKAGRELEIREEDTWLRLGSLIARMHNVAAAQKVSARTRLHPASSLQRDLEHLLCSGHIPPEFLGPFARVSEKICKHIQPLFNEVEYIPVHGDCHSGNILQRPGEGLMLIDFDDMAVAPAVQDLWLLLPDHAARCFVELDLILEGYRQFRRFDQRTLRLIEPLRAMRIIYFLSWCSKQVRDPDFARNFPAWGSPGFWTEELADLESQWEALAEEPGLLE